MNNWDVKRVSRIAKCEEVLSKYNMNHDEIGRFSTSDNNTTGQGGPSSAAGKAKEKRKGSKKKQVDPKPKATKETKEPESKEKKGSRKNPHVTKDMKEAARLIVAGEHVRLESVSELNTLNNELRDMIQKAKKTGDVPPTWNMCTVSVPGTNLFCAQHKGIPRVKMPQTKGIPVKGSKADKLPKDKKGEVDASKAFVKQLKSEGFKVTETKMKASKLRATQNELKGKQVVEMIDAANNKKFNPVDKPIFVSSDGYVIDGHHRWATTVGMDASDGDLGDLSMNVIVIDMTISEVIPYANDFANEFGIAAKSAK
jgi:hypothetical protein